MEQACSIQVPHNRVTIAAHLMSTLRYDSVLIPVALLNGIYCCFPSTLQWYFSVTVFLWHFVVFIKGDGAVPAAISHSELCDML